jgi:histidine ammonia-lyase
MSLTASDSAIREARVSASGVSREELIGVAREGFAVSLTQDARAALEAGAAVVRELVDSGEAIYGVSTGFGSLATTPIPAARRGELQRSLVRSHAAGMGTPVEAEVVRAMMLLRVRSLSLGYSGVRPEVAEGLVALDR